MMIRKGMWIQGMLSAFGFAPNDGLAFVQKISKAANTVLRACSLMFVQALQRVASVSGDDSTPQKIAVTRMG